MRLFKKIFFSLCSLPEFKMSYNSRLPISHPRGWNRDGLRNSLNLGRCKEFRGWTVLWKKSLKGYKYTEITTSSGNPLSWNLLEFRRLLRRTGRNTCPTIILPQAPGYGYCWENTEKHGPLDLIITCNFYRWQMQLPSDSPKFISLFVCRLSEERGKQLFIS